MEDLIIVIQYGLQGLEDLGEWEVCAEADTIMGDLEEWADIMEVEEGTEEAMAVAADEVYMSMIMLSLVFIIWLFYLEGTEFVSFHASTIQFLNYNFYYINSIFFMTSVPSKLIVQLQKQRRNKHKITVDQGNLEETYQILTKIQSKNLMLIELLVFLIQKGFVKNQHKLHYYLDLYDSIKGTISQQVTVSTKGNTDEQEKFTLQKFIKVFQQMAKKFYPNDPLGFQNNIYKVIISNQHAQDVRIKMDDNIKKYLTRDIINIFRNYQREFEIIYEVYLPQNFNSKMCFSWQQIKYLEKKLPIVGFYRFLVDCQIIPNYISPTHFIEVISKIIPPQSLLIHSSQKQSSFFNSQNFANYSKDANNLKKIKIIQGDIGVNYLQMLILLVRFSIDVTKQKADIPKALQTFLNLIKLKQTISNKGQVKCKPNKFEESIKSYFDEGKKANKNSLQVQKRETKKKIQQILQLNQHIEEDSKNQFKDSNVSVNELITIKKSLQDDHLPYIPEKPVVEKQNDSQYNIENKHIVIGEQLPKLPQKNKPAAPKKLQKKDENIKKFKQQQNTPPNLSSDHYNQIIYAPKKPRINHQFPILLMDAVYPSDIPNLYLNPKSQIYLQTTYIHLGERSYEKAFINYIKARTICQTQKGQIVQFFFSILQAQIYQAAARDGMALLNYHKAKQIANAMTIKDNTLKYIAYKGLACCLYHIEEYQYSLRCFLKTKQLKGQQIELQSVENAVLQNNIGCLYMILNRNNEAMKYFALSHSIMDLKLGKFHQKSVVVQQNQGKNKKAFIQMVPTYKTMWKTFVEKPNLKPANKVAKKK